MKKIVFSLLFVLTIAFTFAQDVNQFDSNNKRHGKWEKNYNNGRIRYQGEFNHGKEIGVFKYYAVDVSKFPIIIRRFNQNDNIADVTFYTKKAKLQSKGKMDAKKRIGKWVYYHKDGKTIMQEENYANGVLDGKYLTFYPSSKPTVITNYKNGVMHGNYKRYTIQNKMYQDLNYVNGKLDGEAILYDRSSGLILEKGTYKNDEKIATWTFYVEGEFSHTKEIFPIKE